MLVVLRRLLYGATVLLVLVGVACVLVNWGVPSVVVAFLPSVVFLLYAVGVVIDWWLRDKRG